MCCFWLGPGVPRAVTRVSFNAGSRISGVWADVGAAGWCFILSVAGEFGWIGKGNSETVIARLKPQSGAGVFGDVFQENCVEESAESKGKAVQAVLADGT